MEGLSEAEGDSLGIMEGLSEGDLLGTLLGIMEGLSEGDLLGTSLGIMEGLTEGEGLSEGPELSVHGPK